MPSSTSSFERSIPALGFRRMLALALVTALLGVASWEGYWRQNGLVTAPRNSTNLWIDARRRVDREGHDATVFIGSSRTQFNIDLDVWAHQLHTIHPIQLALEGTSPAAFLRNLAEDEDFSGFLVVGITPAPYFSQPTNFRQHYIRRYERQSPSTRVGHRLSLALDRHFAFLDSYTKLFTVVGRLPWPRRPADVLEFPDLRKLSVIREDRQTELWHRISDDAEYREYIRENWLKMLAMPPLPGTPKSPPVSAIVGEAARHVQRIRDRGGEVVFVRFPSSGPFRSYERETYPRATHWDRLIAETGALGLHFEDHEGLQGYELPEWSHIEAGEKAAFTAELASLLAPTFDAWRHRLAMAP